MVKFWRHAHDPPAGRRSAEAESDTGVCPEVRELAAAEVVAFGGVGIAGQVLPATKAYQTIEEMLPERAEEFRSQLSWLLANGSPAGRVYAATLIGRFDPAAGDAAWRSLAGDQSEFTTFSGCVMNRTTLAEYAIDRLDHR